MHFHLPIEQLVRRTDTRFQLGFATEAKTLVPEEEEFLLSPSENGLHVLATNEDALASPIETLRDAYGSRLDVSAPKVRLMGGVQLQEPIMHLRISLESRFREAVKRALHARDATMEEEYMRPTYSVLRYEAPLADLLGLPAELSRLTSGTARHWIVLSHYAIVTRDPGGRAA